MSQRPLQKHSPTSLFNSSCDERTATEGCGLCPLFVACAHVPANQLGDLSITRTSAHVTSQELFTQHSTGFPHDATVIHRALAQVVICGDTVLSVLLLQDVVSCQSRGSYMKASSRKRETHVGIRNSLVYFYSGGNRSTPVPGNIKYIYRDQGKCLLAVQRQPPASDDTPDLYAIYPDFPAKLYSSQLSAELEQDQVDWIHSHYARWNLSASQSVVLSLSRVCCLISCTSISLLIYILSGINFI
jgi:hypothetical protein